MDAASFDLGIRGVFIGKFNVIQMWHGEPIKKIGFLSDLYISRRNPVVLFFEKHEYKRYKYILSNPGTKDILVGAFQNKNVLNIGIPRNDLLLHQDIQDLCKNEVVEEYVKSKKKNLKKIFLFSPTFRETMDSDYFSVYELSKLNDVFQRNNILCLIKKHINEKRVFLGNNKYSNIIDVTQELPFDSTDFLPFIDTIITDYSSIYIDFLLTNKPVIWYQSDLDDYINKERGFLYDLKDVVITQSTASNFDEFINIIENMDYIAEEKEYKKSYKELREKFYGKDIEKSYACRDLTRILNLSSKI